MAKKRDRPVDCLNCGERLTGKYCPECGQKNTDFRESIWHVIAEVLEEAVSFDSKLYRSIFFLLLRPGYLSREYNEGKRVRYIRPFRIYLFSSIVYFFLLSIYGPLRIFDDKIGVGDNSEEAGWEMADTVANVVTDSGGVQEELKDPNKIFLGPFSEAVPESLLNDITDSTTSIKVIGMDFEEWDSLIEGWKSAGEDTGNTIVGSTYLYTRAKNYIIDQFERLKAMPNKELESSFVADLEKNLPTMMFFLLPVVALILKIIYPLSRRFYIEHLIFSLHIHSFIFLLMTLLLVFDYPSFSGIAPFVVLLYLFLAMRTTYLQSVIGTLGKLFLLLILYSLSLGTVFALTALITIALI